MSNEKCKIYIIGPAIGKVRKSIENQLRKDGDKINQAAMVQKNFWMSCGATSNWSRYESGESDPPDDVIEAAYHRLKLYRPRLTMDALWGVGGKEDLDSLTGGKIKIIVEKPDNIEVIFQAQPNKSQGD